jgi:hypothetical protein
MQNPSNTFKAPNSDSESDSSIMDLSKLIAALGPLSWLILPFAFFGGLGFVGIYYASALLLFWHIAAPICLLLIELFRRSRGLSLGRGVYFGFGWFLLLDLYAITIGHNSIDILGLFFDKSHLLYLMIFMGSCSVIFFSVCFYRRFRKHYEISVMNDLFLSLSVSILVTIGLAYGICVGSYKIWSDKQKYEVTIQLVDAVTLAPLDNAHLEFVDNVFDAKVTQSLSDGAGIGKAFGWGNTRISISKSGYIDQIVWINHNMVSVSWEEDDGYMTPLLSFEKPFINWKQKELTVYLQPKGNAINLPYPFYLKKASSGAIHLCLLDAGSNDPNTMDPEGLPDEVKEPFIAFQKRRWKVEKEFIEKENKSRDDQILTIHSRKRMPFYFGKSYSRGENLSLGIKSFVEGDDLDKTIEDYFEFIRKYDNENRGRNKGAIILSKRKYLEVYPNSPLRLYVLLVLLYEHKYGDYSMKRWPAEDEEVTPTASAIIKSERLENYKKLCAELESCPDPLVRYLAKEIIENIISDFYPTD